MYPVPPLTDTLHSEFIIDMVNITQGTPIPPRRYRDTVYPFKTMEVGDSFDVYTIDVADIRRVTSRVSSACATYSRRNNVKFTIRKMDSDFIRVWRVS